MPRTIVTRYSGHCADCGADIPEGSEARYYGRGRIYGIDCHTKGGTPALIDALNGASTVAVTAYAAYVAEHYTKPAFEVVENAPGDLFHNPNAPTRIVDTMFDVCGFVSVRIDNRRNNGAPGARLIREFKNHGTECPGYSGDIELGAFKLHKTSYSGEAGLWYLWGPVSGGTGNGALSAATAGAKAFAASMAEAGYEGLRVESRID